MWKSTSIERVLFSWPVWRSSIIRRWIHPEINWATLPPDKVRDIAANEIISFGFPYCLLFEIYWLSCLVSDYNLSVPYTFRYICVPAFVPSIYKPLIHFDESIMDRRSYPPKIFRESDLKFHNLSHLQKSIEIMGKYSPGLVDSFMFLPANHHFYKVLNEYHSRNATSKRLGRPPKYSDRLAVACAARKNEGRTLLEVANEFTLPKTKPYNSWQSDIARNLIKRGQILIESLNDSN
jgi:hypothetical protein